MKLTLTRKHLNKAIRQKALYKGQLITADICPVAQVLTEKFPNDRVQVFGSYLWFNGKAIRTTSNMRKIIGLFDNNDYKTLRKILPLSFILRK